MDKAPKLLSGGNPQIAKGHGDGPVQGYIAALPGWKRRVGVQVDREISDALPEVQKAVKWNSPFYGMGDRWFLSFHCIARYVKIGFFQGTSLDPMPPVASKVEGVRYLHIGEADVLDQAQFADWVQQASHLPGTRM